MENIEPGFLSVVPALVAIGLAFITRQVLLSLFMGIVAGGIVMGIETGDIKNANIVSKIFLPALGTKSYATILLVYLWSLGGLMGMWEKTGGAIHFAEWAGAKIQTFALGLEKKHGLKNMGSKASLFFAWILGCIFHQGGTVSTVLAGTTVKPVTDKNSISHEELSYVVDSTASPVATVIPFNAWPAFIGALVVGTVPEIFPTEDASQNFFFSSIKYNFYGMFAVLATLLFSLGLMPWIGGKMRRARIRSRKTGELDAEGANPMLPTTDPDVDPANNRAEGYVPSLLDFFVPLGVLLGVAVIPKVTEQLGLLTAFIEMGLVKDGNFVNEAFMLCVLSAMVVAGLRGMKLQDVLNGFVDGCKTMTIGAIILGLAVAIGFIAKELHTADYLVGIMGDKLPVMGLPAILTVLCMVIAFSCGTSWGTYAVVFPVAMPLAWAVFPDPAYLSICFGAVLGGAVFGDQCSPISDTTILSAMFTGCDLMDHVTTQLPLALTVASIGAVFSTFMVYYKFFL